MEHGRKNMLKYWNRWFWPANGMGSTQSLVKIHNKRNLSKIKIRHIHNLSLHELLIVSIWNCCWFVLKLACSRWGIKFVFILNKRDKRPSCKKLLMKNWLKLILSSNSHPTFQSDNKIEKLFRNFQLPRRTQNCSYFFKISLILYPPASKAIREVANLTERTNLHAPVYLGQGSQREYISSF